LVCLNVRDRYNLQVLESLVARDERTRFLLPVDGENKIKQSITMPRTFQRRGHFVSP
jgi:hypothetical protein